MRNQVPSVTERLDGVRSQIAAARAQLLDARGVLAALRVEHESGSNSTATGGKGAQAAAIRRITNEARSTERALDSVLIEVAQRTDQLAAAGTSADASEALLGVGEVSGRTARRESARGRVARSMPQLGDALAAGTVGGEHLDAIARASARLDEREQTALEAKQDELASAAERLPVDAFGRLVRGEVDRIRRDHGLQRALDQKARSEFRSWEGSDGMGHFRGSLDLERFAVLRGAIDREVTALANDSDGAVTKNANTAAAALMELVSHGNGRHGRAHITVVVDADTVMTGPHDATLCELGDGAPIPPETMQRHTCNALIRKVVVDTNGVPLEVGRAARTATPAQWAGMEAEHATCRWSGCDQPISRCQAHHIIEWERGGRTDLGNLVPLCSRHHHAVHEGRWNVRLMADRTLRIWRPDGAHHADAPTGRLDRWLEDRTRSRTGDPPPTKRRTNDN